MRALTPKSPPTGAALLQWTSRVLDVILHIGAHRTGTTSFQDYLRRHRAHFASKGVGVWEPRQTRRGLFAGIASEATEGMHALRVKTQLEQAREQGVSKLIVSEENMIGSVRNNIANRELYRNVGEHMERFARAFDGTITTILLCTRRLDLHWCSALAFGVSRGHAVLSRRELRQIALSTRSWRSVIEDVAAAVPGAAIRVLPFEQFVGRSERILACGSEIEAPFDSERNWLNRTPTLPDLRRALSDRGDQAASLPFGMGRWNPFTSEEHAALREMHADDMMWLTSGADGKATLTEDRDQERAAQMPPLIAQAKGQCDELEERQLACPGRR